MGHLDLAHLDLGHLDLGHLDLAHLDSGHLDLAHLDLGHLDLAHLDLAPGYNKANLKESCLLSLVVKRCFLWKNFNYSHAFSLSLTKHLKCFAEEHNTTT